MIADPNPCNPFEELPHRLFEAWGAAASPVWLFALAVLAARQGKWKLPRWAVAGLWAAVLVIGGVNLYANGRVAFSSTMAIKLVLLCATCFLLFHIVKLLKERRMFIAAFYLSLLLVSAYLLYLPMRYA